MPKDVLTTRKSAFHWFIGKSFPNDRFVINTARLVLLFVLCSVIMVTAMLTWKVSVNAMSNSLDFMSAQLREDVTQGAMASLKELLTGVSASTTSLYRALDGVGSGFSRADIGAVLLPVAWSTFSTSADVSGVHIMTAEGLFMGYRRDGPEARLLGQREVVAIPAPPNDTLSLAYGFVPDPVTGRPQLDGRMVKLCAIGSCPVVMDPTVYVPPTIAPLSSPAWTLGRTLARGGMQVYMAISSALEPTLSVTASFKSAAGEQLAVVVISALCSRLLAYIQATSAVRVFGGRVCIAEGPRLNILSASNGTLYTPPAAAGARPTLASAFNSSDAVTRETARYLDNTYGSALFLRPTQSRARLAGHGVHYIRAMPLRFEGLKLVVMLAVPRDEFHGDIEHSQRHGLLITLGIVASMFVLGGLAICGSTLLISRKLSDQEKGLGEAAEANRALIEHLQSLRQLDADGWPHVDLGTPLEKLTAIIKTLKPSRVLSPHQVQQMQALISAEDLHKPQFLSSIRTDGAEGSDGVCSGGLDLLGSETGKWIALLATGRRVRSQLHLASPGTPFASPSSTDAKCRAPRRLEATLLDEAEAGTLSAMVEEGRTLHPLSPAGSGEDGERSTKHDGSPRAAACHPMRSARSHGDTPSGEARFFSLRRHTGHMAMCQLSAVRAVVLAAMPMAEPSTPKGGPLVERNFRKSVSSFGKKDPLRSLSVTSRASSFPSPPPLAVLQVLADVPSNMTELQLQQVAILRTLGEWDFDAVSLHSLSGEMTIPLVGYSLFLRGGFILEFDINEQKLANFLLEIARGMASNPYHNAAHIADVAASLYHLLLRSGICDHLRSIDKLAVLTAVLVHDYKHPGVNNDFLSRTREELATVYNDHSPLENYHLAEAFCLLYSRDECNFLEVLSEEDFMEVRRLVIDVVLATDLKRHFGVLDAFKARVSQEQPWDMERDSDRISLLQLAIKVADIGHAAKPLFLHKEWSYRAIEEFYLQGDAERALNLKVSPFMDRHANSVPRSQLGFFQFLALPLFEAWVKSFPTSGHLLVNVSANVEYWKQELLKNAGSPS